MDHRTCQDMGFVTQMLTHTKIRQNTVHFIDLKWRAVIICDNSVNHFKASLLRCQSCFNKIQQLLSSRTMTKYHTIFK